MIVGQKARLSSVALKDFGGEKPDIFVITAVYLEDRRKYYECKGLGKISEDSKKIYGIAGKKNKYSFNSCELRAIIVCPHCGKSKKIVKATYANGAIYEECEDCNSVIRPVNKKAKEDYK